MFNELISIAIPAYKAKYLKEAIDSILKQTYPNFELIIVNDKSPEDLDSIVYSFKDSRIKYYKNETNLGKKSIVHNWNKCISLAKGVYFVLLCDDDIMLPDFLAIMIQYAKKYPHCNVFKTRCYIFNSTDYKILNETPLWEEYQTFDVFFDYKMRRMRKHTISEFFYRTNHIKKFKYIPFPIGYYSDDASILKLIENGGLCSTKEILIKFRKSDIHITGNQSYNLKKAEAAISYYNWLSKSYHDKFKVYYNLIYYKISDDLYSYFINSNTITDAFYILLKVPRHIWSFKRKVANLYHYLKLSVI